MSFDDYYSRRNLQSARNDSILASSPAVTFIEPQETTLYGHLTAILGVPPTQAQENYIAWLLGLWIADGVSRKPTVTQGGPHLGHRHCHHEVFDALLWYGGTQYEPSGEQLGALFSGRRRGVEGVEKLHSHDSSAHNPVYEFRFRTRSVFGLVLRRYNLIDNKHIPAAIIRDDLEVRQRLIAGLMDGDGHYKANEYEICAEELRVADGYRMLARSCGMRAGNLLETRCTNAETGRVYDGYKITLSGDMWECSRYCVLTYKERVCSVIPASACIQQAHARTDSPPPLNHLATTFDSLSTPSTPSLCPTSLASS